MLLFFSFGLSRKTTNIYNNIAGKHGKFTVKDFRKYEKLMYKQNELKLDHQFFQQLQST